MSYPVFYSTIPFTRGPGWHKTAHFNTLTQKPVAGRGVVTASLVPYPTWDFEVSIEWVRGDESTPASIIASFLDIYGQCLGSGQFFLFTDPRDNTIAQGVSAMLNTTPGAAVPMGTTGDGVSTQFQLARTIGPSGLFLDIIQNVNGTPIIYVGGTPTLAYSISSTGVITFNTAPANNATLQWSGAFYFLCQFAEDSLADLSRVGCIPNLDNPSDFDGLWSCGNIKFSSVFI